MNALRKSFSKPLLYAVLSVAVLVTQRESVAKGGPGGAPRPSQKNKGALMQKQRTVGQKTSDLKPGVKQVGQLDQANQQADLAIEKRKQAELKARIDKRTQDARRLEKHGINTFTRGHTPVDIDGKAMVYPKGSPAHVDFIKGPNGKVVDTRVRATHPRISELQEDAR